MGQVKLTTLRARSCTYLLISKSSSHIMPGPNSCIGLQISPFHVFAATMRRYAQYECHSYTSHALLGDPQCSRGLTQGVPAASNTLRHDSHAQEKWECGRPKSASSVVGDVAPGKPRGVEVVWLSVGSWLFGYFHLLVVPGLHKSPAAHNRCGACNFRIHHQMILKSQNLGVPNIQKQP